MYRESFSSFETYQGYQSSYPGRGSEDYTLDGALGSCPVAAEFGNRVSVVWGPEILPADEPGSRLGHPDHQYPL